MNWKWLFTPAEPRWLFAVLVGLFVGIGLFVSYSYWPEIGGVGRAVIAACLGGFGGIFAKLILERGKN